jgi:hypothetical protein
MIELPAEELALSPASQTRATRMNELLKNPLIIAATERLAKLQAFKPVAPRQVVWTSPGVYLFTENGEPMWVGRTDCLCRRIREHCSGRMNGAPLAVKIAREATGYFATYTKKGGLKELERKLPFVRAFARAQDRVRKMELSWVFEPDPTIQALAEILGIIGLQPRYNSLKTS